MPRSNVGHTWQSGISWREKSQYLLLIENQHNIRISRESAELWRLNDPEVRQLTETRQRKWIWMRQRVVQGNTFEISIQAWFSFLTTLSSPSNANNIVNPKICAMFSILWMLTT
jgi:hypothetical protein